jgi:peptidoglycan/xylan/chitin deacetylase (PgdA/CDA1 family)
VPAITTPAILAATTATGLLAGGLWYASAWPTSQLFGRTLIAGSNPNEIALTFDDGPNDAATPQLLDLLAGHNVRATFFLIGDFARREPALVRRIAAEGHLIGNHTMSHPRLSIQPAAQIGKELAACSALLEEITGKPIRLFRPPFGARRPFVLRAARSLGLIPVMWNVTAYDWNPIGADAILTHIQRGIARNQRLQRASNLLLHDGGHRAMSSPRMDTVRAVERLLGEHADTPRRFVTPEAWPALTL